MPKPLSSDLRTRFQKLYTDGLTGREIGRRLMISAASASRLGRKIMRGEGLDPAPNPRRTGSGRLVPYEDFLTELVEQEPDITLKELQGALEHAHGVRASISGIDQVLRRCGFTYKKSHSSRMSASERG